MNESNEKKIRFEITAKNNRLYKKIYSQYPSLAEFCRVEFVNKYQSILSFLTLRTSPYQEGGMSPIALRLCEIFHEDPEWLFPPELYGNTARKKWIVEANLKRLTLIQEARQQIKWEPQVDDGVLKKVIAKQLDMLNERESRVIKLRFGLDKTCERTLVEIGQILKVTPEQVRQIEAKAIRRLRHPSRMIHLQRATDF